MRLKTLIQARTSIMKFLETELSGAVGFKFRKINRELSTIFQDFDASFLSLLKNYGKQQESGQFIVEKENIIEFNNEYEKIMDEKIELNFKPIVFTELQEKDFENLKLSPKDWDLLEGILIQE